MSGNSAAPFKSSTEFLKFSNCALDDYFQKPAPSKIHLTQGRTSSSFNLVLDGLPRLLDSCIRPTHNFASRLQVHPEASNLSLDLLSSRY